MSVVQWLLLIFAIGGVIAVYVVTKRREGPNPWQDMQTTGDNGQETIPPGPDTNFEDLQPEVKTSSAPEFEGLVGADDVPDLPATSDPLVADDQDLPDFEVRAEVETDKESASASEPEVNLNPSGLKRSGASATSDGDQRIVVLHVACRDGQYFQGEEVHAALRNCKLQFGMQDVYHRITEENGVPESVFTVANMLKPGFLNPDEAAGLQTPGLTMFMILPGPVDGVGAFKDMMETANNLAQKLGGEVLDDTRVLLKRQTAQFMLDEIAEAERKQRLKTRHG